MDKQPLREAVEWMTESVLGDTINSSSGRRGRAGPRFTAVVTDAGQIVPHSQVKTTLEDWTFYQVSAGPARD